MKRFTQLYSALDETTSTNRKVAAMVDYFASAPPEDAVWAAYFLSGRRPKRLLSSRAMRRWAAAAADLKQLGDGEPAPMPEWMFEACYSEVGDLAETISLVVSSDQQGEERPLHYWVEERLLPMRKMDEAEQQAEMTRIWKQFSQPERFVWTKLTTSALRVGVGKKLLIRALSTFSGLDKAVLSHRLMGPWKPTPAFYEQLLSEDATDAAASQPYPFCLARPLEDEVTSLGAPDDYLVEWKADGIRAQLICRAGEVFIWSRGEEQIGHQYPEVQEAATAYVPDGTVLDGELLAFREGEVLPFGQMQRRIGRKNVSKKMQQEVPVVFVAYDLLEHEGMDIREQSLQERRQKLEVLANTHLTSERFQLSPLLSGSWAELHTLREESRERNMEGFMLKRADAPYVGGRKTGIWWKWKVDPYTLDAVMIYAQSGSGRRASLYTDYTFGLWQGDELKPFAKGYFGLTDDEFEEITRWVRRNTIDRFGPVRQVEPELVFEIAFEGVRRNNRKDIGMSVRFPRMARWRRDLSPSDADSVEDLRRLLPDLPA